MPFLLAVFLTIFALYIPANLVTWLLLRGLKVKTEEVRIFEGKAVASWRLGGVEWKLGWIPSTISLRFDDAACMALPRWLQALLHFLMPAVVAVIGVVLLGGAEAWHHLLSGMRQFFEGGIHPQRVAWVLVDKLRQLYATQGAMPRFAGVVAMKLVALSCLPIGVTAVTSALDALLRRPGAEDPPTWLKCVMLYGWMLTLVLQVLWLGGLLVYAVRG